MKPPHRIILGAAILGLLTASAQTDELDPIVEAILSINESNRPKLNEVTVVLDPSSASPLPSDEADETEPSADPETPPAADRKTSPPAPKDASAKPATTQSPPEPPAASPQGLEVRVEKIRSSQGRIDPSQVKLKAPFPAKPLAQAPAGWRLEAPRDAPPFSREVELSPGSFITLSIRPHLLIPENDGGGIIAVSEPGYEPSLGYHQNTTVGAVLAGSVENLEEDARRIGDAIEFLQQLLVSLPLTDSESHPK